MPLLFLTKVITFFFPISCWFHGHFVVISHVYMLSCLICGNLVVICLKVCVFMHENGVYMCFTCFSIMQNFVCLMNSTLAEPNLEWMMMVLVSFSLELILIYHFVTNVKLGDQTEKMENFCSNKSHVWPNLNEYFCHVLLLIPSWFHALMMCFHDGFGWLRTKLQMSKSLGTSLQMIEISLFYGQRIWPKASWITWKLILGISYHALGIFHTLGGIL